MHLGQPACAAAYRGTKQWPRRWAGQSPPAHPRPGRTANPSPAPRKAARRRSYPSPADAGETPGARERSVPEPTRQTGISGSSSGVECHVLLMNEANASRAPVVRSRSPWFCPCPPVSKPVPTASMKTRSLRSSRLSPLFTILYGAGPLACAFAVSTIRGPKDPYAKPDCRRTGAAIVEKGHGAPHRVRNAAPGVRHVKHRFHRWSPFESASSRRWRCS